MKKVLFIFACVLGLSSMAEAQISAGKYSFGGSVNLGFSNTNIQINPNGGYFFTDDLAGVAGIGLSIVDVAGTSTTNFSFNAGVRKYWSILDNTYFYGHAGFGYTQGGAGSININLYPGVTYFFNERVAIDGAMNGLGGGGIGLMLLF